MAKLAILTERLKPGFGVDLVVNQQATLLSKKHDLAVFAVEIDQQFVENATYPVHRTPIPLFFNPLKQDYSSWKYFKQYHTQLSRFDTFVINTPTFNAWIPQLAKMGRVFVQYFGNSPSRSYKGLKRYRKNIFDWSEGYFYFRYPQRIISISQFLKDSLPLSVREKTSVIPLAADHITKKYLKISMTERKRILKNFFISPKEKLITYVGRLSYLENPYKNTYDLIRLRQAMNEKRGSQVKVLAIGLPQNQIEKEFYKNGVAVVPQATDNELAVLMSQSYLYFSPSRWEGFNLPLLEAQALGVPVIAYKVGAHQEVVQNNQTGFLVETFSEATKKIHELLKNPEKQKRMSDKALIWAQDFSWRKNALALEKVLWP